MRLRVEMGEGRARGQSVRTEEGELVEGMKSIEWKANAVDRPIVVVELYAERVDFDLGSSDTPSPTTPAEPAPER
jgi:hypothetical protein